MQIWFLDKSPTKSAEILMAKSPKRARKFVIELMQATAYLCERHGSPLPIKKDGTPYKTKLASRFPKVLLEWLENSNNLKWAKKMAVKIHILTNTWNPLNVDNMYQASKLALNLKNGTSQTPLPNYAKNKQKGLDFTHIKDTCKAYNMYLDAQLNK